MTTFRSQDLVKLKDLLVQNPEPLDRAGIHPTAEQIELYAFHLPQTHLSNLIVSQIIFVINTCSSFGAGRCNWYKILPFIYPYCPSIRLFSKL